MDASDILVVILIIILLIVIGYTTYINVLTNKLGPLRFPFSQRQVFDDLFEDYTPEQKADVIARSK